MSPEVDREIFPYYVQFLSDDFTYDGLTPRLVDLDTDKEIDLKNAFKESLNKSKLPSRELTCKFFFFFVFIAIRVLESSFVWAFLRFDHDDDDGPAYDDKYLDIIKKVQRDLVNQIGQAIQHESQSLVSSQLIESLLEDSGARSLLHRYTPEYILGFSHDELRLTNLRRLYAKNDILNIDIDNFETALAKYETRRNGLKVRDNSELVSRLSNEIRTRTLALEKPGAKSSQELSTSAPIQPEVNGIYEKSCTVTPKKRGKGPDTGQIWKHLTISRDETSASDFLHERILVLFFKTQHLNYEPTEPKKLRTEHREAPETSQIEQKTHSIPVYPRTNTGTEQPHSRHNWYWQASLGTPSTQRLDYSPRVKDMEVSSPSSMVGTEEDGDSSEMSPPGVDNLQYRQLISRITSLELENQLLKKDQATGGNWKTIHFITASSGQEPSGFFDKPVLAPGFKHDDFTLKAFLPVTDVGGYVKQAGLGFVISRFYSAQTLLGEVRRAMAKKQPPPEPLHYREHIQLQSQEMIEAMQEFLSLQPEFWENFSGFDARAPIEAPYIFWYTYRSPEALRQLKQPHRDLMRMLTSWIDKNYAEKYAEAEMQLRNGVVTLRTMPFLVCPGDVLIWKEKAKIKAAITSSLLVQQTPPILYWDSSQITWSDSNTKDGTKKGEFLARWTVETWKYKFNGEFIPDKGSAEIKFKATSLDQEVEISKLGVYPLRFADEKTRLQLETRGKTFWSCRNRNLVSYTGEEGMFTVGRPSVC